MAAKGIKQSRWKQMESRKFFNKEHLADQSTSGILQQGTRFAVERLWEESQPEEKHLQNPRQPKGQMAILSQI
jgi:hypothetical protein